MKATGIIRRIDDLGRVVIPKEIRKNLRIKEGDNLEIFVVNEDIILKKYSMMNKINDLAQELTDAIYTFMKHSIFITDTDQVVAASGPLKKKYLNKNISDFITESIKRRDKILENHFKELNFIEDEKLTCSYVMSTILVNGEATGMILIISEEEKMSESEMQMAGIVSSFMTKYLEQ
ncbi:MAG: AbrB/MazE/SpoVT family DNA-binding domain-containing protein [Bacilli bacterium]|jgi:AbrB family transcriptional regulator (stage V sporulation protein T)|nr:AbrB/MazE/SpoVT family DNA-binding domain-containing protein [Bacilli bacterium]